MAIRCIFGFILATIALSPVALAEGRSEIDEVQLPPGKTKAQVQAMLDEIDRKSARETEQELAQLERQEERLNRALKKYEDRLTKAVDRDPELRALRDKLEAGAQALANPQLSNEERNARAERMAPDREELRRRAFAKAGIDERAMNAEIVREVNNDVVTRSADRGELISELTMDEDGALFFTAPNNEGAEPLPQVTTRGTSTVTLGDPWPYEHTGDGGPACNKCYVDKAKGEYGVGVYNSRVSGQNYRGLAHFRTVRSGDRKFRVSAQLPETGWSVSATSFVLGSARARTWSKIEVWDESAKRLCRSARLHGDVLSTWGQHRRKNGTDTTALGCEFQAPPVNHEIVIRFISGVYIKNSDAFGYSGGYVTGTPANVRLYVTR